LEFNDELYVFGGFGDGEMTFSLPTVERYRNNRWEIFNVAAELPWCSAAAVGDRIYLGSTDTNIFELDPEQMTGRMLEIQLSPGSKTFFSWFDYLWVLESGALRKFDISE
jgi:hypothetical protein